MPVSNMKKKEKKKNASKTPLKDTIFYKKRNDYWVKVLNTL